MKIRFSRLGGPVLAVLCGLASLVGPAEIARAEDRAAEMPKFPASVDELSAPRLPPPFVLPELSHRSWDLGVSWLVGVGQPATVGGPPLALGLARASIEGDVGFPRRLYIGLTLPFASALSPDHESGTKTVMGNVEAHVRVVFPLPSWLAFGAVLGIVAPTARFDAGSGTGRGAAAASSLEPTDAIYFQPRAFSLRPGVDARILRGPFVLQVRQGIAVDLDTLLGRAVTTGRFLGHAGWRITPKVELSYELTQSYLFDESVSDHRRTAVTMGPGARLSLGSIDVGAAVFTSVFDPYSPDLDRLVGLRLSLVAPID